MPKLPSRPIEAREQWDSEGTRPALGFGGNSPAVPGRTAKEPSGATHTRSERRRERQRRASDDDTAGAEPRRWRCSGATRLTIDRGPRRSGGEAERGNLALGRRPLRRSSVARIRRVVTFYCLRREVLGSDLISGGGMRVHTARGFCSSEFDWGAYPIALYSFQVWNAF